MAGLDCDALALLAVRLNSDQPGQSDLCWHPWNAVVGAEQHGLSPEAASRPQRTAPFKRFPGNGGRPYFNAHVERLLFPPSDSDGSRWVCCPDELYLDIGFPGKPVRTARIELLERLTTPVQSGGTLGLIHLSLDPSGEAGAPDTLSWASLLRSTFRRPRNRSEFVLWRGKEGVTLGGTRPLRGLVEELFGDPHEDLDRHLYTALMADYPAEAHNNPELQKRWRRALAARSYKLAEDPADDEDLADEEDLMDKDLERERRQTMRIADATGLVLANCAVFTGKELIDGESARSFRSYWAESLVFGLLQQGCLEGFQHRLAEIPEPLDPKIERLHLDWLSFRNLIWWSQLSTANPPQELLSLLREAQGTDRLFVDLEGDLATYSDQRHRVVEDRQAKGLANLQVYGAGIVVLGPLTTVIAMVGASDASVQFLAVLLAAALLAAVGVSYLVRWLLERASGEPSSNRIHWRRRGRLPPAG